MDAEDQFRRQLLMERPLEPFEHYVTEVMRLDLPVYLQALLFWKKTRRTAWLLGPVVSEQPRMAYILFEGDDIYSM